MYVLVSRGRWFVSRSGEEHSYTRDLLRARVYRSYEQAERERCPESERVVPLEALLTVVED